MLRGMTAFGRATSSSSSGDLTIELSSLNRRHLELRLNLPHCLQPLEGELRKRLSHVCTRGVVTLTASFDRQTQVALAPNFPLLAQLKQGAQSIAEALEVDYTTAVGLAMRSTGQLGSLMAQEERELNEDWAFATCDAAIDHLLEAKQAEGAAIQKALCQQLDQLSELHTVVEKEAPKVSEAYRQKLLKRIGEWGVKPEEDERLLREIGLHAERSDISEELQRWDHHLAQTRAAVLGEEQVSGKMLEFRVQELQREINTLSAKAGSIAISESAVKARAALEKIREQLANVE